MLNVDLNEDLHWDYKAFQTEIVTKMISGIVI